MLAIAVDLSVAGPAVASLVAEQNTTFQTVRSASASGVRVAQATSNNPLAVFFSIFEKKKPEPRPRIVPQGKPLPGGVIIQQRGQGRGIGRGNGRRIFNPFIGGGVGNGLADQSQKPKTFGTGRRTMCVRLCDGYYWPMRRGGSNSSLATDSIRCETQCTSPARLFVLHTSTDDIGDMRDLGGRRYSKLENAFAYRKTYNPSCGCRAKPWSERARLRHKSYAAVGRERRALAIRAIRLDLRSTLKPDADPKLVLTSDARVVSGLSDPALPIRRPARQMVDVAHTEVVATSGVLQETSDGAARRQGRHQSLWANSGVFDREGPMPFGTGVRVLGFGDLRHSFQSPADLVPMSRAPRLFSTPQSEASTFVPVSLQLRSSLN